MKNNNINLILLMWMGLCVSVVRAQTPQIGTGPAIPQNKPVKIGYTNIEIVLSYMPEALTVEKQLQAWVEKQQGVIEIKYKYYESEAATFSDKEENKGWHDEAEKNAMLTKLQNLEKEIQDAQANSEEELGQRRMQLLEPIQMKIQAAIDSIAVENGYSYILNQTLGGGIPSIIFGLDQFDVTNLIASKLGITIPEAKKEPK